MTTEEVSVHQMIEQAERKRSGIIYLACPYTHPDHRVRARRYREATKAAAKLIGQGLIVFSPITMTHPIDVELSEQHSTQGSAFWVRFDEAFMAFCDEMVVLRIEGWYESDGVTRERQFFEKLGRPITYLDP